MGTNCPSYNTKYKLTQTVQGQLGAAFLHEDGTNLYLLYRVGVTKVIDETRGT